MKIEISNKIKENFPELKLGVVIANNIVNSKNTFPAKELEIKVLKQVRNRFKSNDDLSNELYVSEWKRIYKEFGTKPSKYRPTVESLIRRIIKGSDLPEINLAVNSYLLAELQTLFPIGGYDIDKIDGNIFLRYSEGNEIFFDFSGKEEKTYNGEIIYSDNNDILTKRWNYRDCKKAQITENSKNIILCVEMPSKLFDSKDLLRTLELIKEYLIEFCQATDVKTSIIE